MSSIELPRIRHGQKAGIPNPLIQPMPMPQLEGLPPYVHSSELARYHGYIDSDLPDIIVTTWDTMWFKHEQVDRATWYHSMGIDAANLGPGLTLSDIDEFFAIPHDIAHPERYYYTAYDQYELLINIGVYSYEDAVQRIETINELQFYSDPVQYPASQEGFAFVPLPTPSEAEWNTLVRDTLLSGKHSRLYTAEYETPTTETRIFGHRLLQRIFEQSDADAIDQEAHAAYEEFRDLLKPTTLGSQAIVSDFKQFIHDVRESSGVIDLKNIRGMSHEEQTAFFLQHAHTSTKTIYVDGLEIELSATPTDSEILKYLHSLDTHIDVFVSFIKWHQMQLFHTIPDVLTVANDMVYTTRAGIRHFFEDEHGVPKPGPVMERDREIILNGFLEPDGNTIIPGFTQDITFELIDPWMSDGFIGLATFSENKYGVLLTHDALTSPIVHKHEQGHISIQGYVPVKESGVWRKNDTEFLRMKSLKELMTVMAHTSEETSGLITDPEQFMDILSTSKHYRELLGVFKQVFSYIPASDHKELIDLLWKSYTEHGVRQPDGTYADADNSAFHRLNALVEKYYAKDFLQHLHEAINTHGILRPDLPEKMREFIDQNRISQLDV